MTERAIPARVAAACRETPERTAWLERLPALIDELESHWSLALGAPFEAEVSCAWVAPATRADGSHAVLKLGMPHMEGEDEIRGLRFWAGDPTVRLLEADEARNAMLLERCEPGTPLRALPEPEQDVVIAGLLRRIWREPPRGGFRALSIMTTHWASEARSRLPRCADPGLVRDGLRLLEELPRTATRSATLATDLHAGNVLRAERETWLVIDPKPFAGDPAYDATQHLLNCDTRLRGSPRDTVSRFADRLEVDPERVRLWLFARAATTAYAPWHELAPELAKP